MDVQVKEYADIVRTYVVCGVKDKDEALQRIYNNEVEPVDVTTQHSEMEMEVIDNGVQ